MQRDRGLEILARLGHFTLGSLQPAERMSQDGLLRTSRGSPREHGDCLLFLAVLLQAGGKQADRRREIGLAGDDTAQILDRRPRAPKLLVKRR